MKLNSIRKRILLIALVLSSFLQVCFSQTKVNFPNAKAIKQTEITTQVKETKTTYLVSPQNLKPGMNYLTLKNGDKFYVEIVKGKVKSFTISKSDGTLIGVVKPGDKVLEFSCNGNICTCNGDADCNRMFSTNSCGPVAVCVGSACACYMSI